jgi:hypothetical protein
MDLHSLCLILSLEILIVLICFISWITKGILWVHNKPNILGMLLIILLTHVEMHMYHC